MATRLEPGSRTVTWTETRQIAVGYHDCANCGVETPEPAMSDLIRFAKMRPNGGVLWPGGTNDSDNWTPPGWTVEYGEGLICPDCTAVKREAFAQRRRAVKK